MGYRPLKVTDDVYIKLREIRDQRTVDNGGQPVTFSQVIAELLGEDWNFLLADQPTQDKVITVSPDLEK